MTSPPQPDRPLQEQAEHLFAAVFSMPIEGRTEALERACRGDPGLRRAVVELLAAHDAPLALLHDADRGPAPGSILSLLPRKIGEFHILELLGRGGMGVVYRAEQEHPRRHVALKVLLPTDANGHSLRRLQQEAEVLGRLQHPGIAQIFGAGTYSSALGEQPFFAMELIEGRSLLEHCKQQELDRRGRCELFAKIADAVQHAHDRGVVHRDLKPGNVLVAMPDARSAQPKVLDFGIARCIDPDQQRSTLTTQSGLLIGTLAYMSPEQFLLGLADARSDVYSLGVMLYELESGKLPFDLAEKSMTEINRLMNEAEAPALRSGSVTPVDLQIIAARALAKDPAERYPTAAALAADLRRFLADEPIHARPPTLAYQLRKFARRHRAFVIGLAATMLALVAGTIVSLAFLFSAQHATALAQRNEYIAQLRTAGGAFRLDPEAARVALESVADRQGLEWQLLQARLDQAVVTSPIGPGPNDLGGPFTLARDEDGRMLHVFVSRDGHTAHLRNADSGEELWQRPLAGAPRPQSLVVLSPSGKRVVFPTDGPRGQELQVCDTATGAELRRIAIDKGEPFAVFTADDRYLVWTDTPGSRDQQLGTVRSLDLATGVTLDIGKRIGRVSPDIAGDAVWMGNHYRFSAATGERLPTPPLGELHESAQTCTYPSPDGRWLAVQREDHRNIILYDATGQQTHVLNGARAGSCDIEFQGERMASVHSAENAVRIWDLRTGRPVHTLLLPGLGGIAHIAFAPDGTRLFCAGSKGAGSIDVREQHGLLVGHSDYILSGVLDRSGRLLATGDTSGELRLWDLDRGTCLGVMRLEGEVHELAFQPGERELWCETWVKTQHTIDLARWCEVPARELLGPRLLGKWGSVVTSSGRRIVTQEAWLAAGQSRLRRELTILDADGAERPVVLEQLVDNRELNAQQILMRKAMTFQRGFCQLAVDASERWLGVGLIDGSFAVVELDTGRILVHRDAHIGPTFAIAVLPAQRRVVTGGLDGTLRFWDMDTWTELYREAGHERGIEGVLPTPDGSRLVTWSADRTIRIWDTKTAAQRYEASRSDAADREAAAAWVDGLWTELGDGDRVADRIAAEVDSATVRWVHVLARQLTRLAQSRK